MYLGYPSELSKLESLLPKWKARAKDAAEEISPCGYATNGPRNGIVTDMIETEKRLYLFIRSSPGAGSGDFGSTIVMYDRTTKKFHRLRSFDLTNETRKKPRNFPFVSQQRNTPFLYKDFMYDLEYGTESEIMRMLRESVK